MTTELIPVREHNGKTAVSLRDLHGFLEVKKDFTNWAKAMFEYGFVEGQDYVEVYAQMGENPSGGRPARNWAISLDMAKELSMIQRTDKGKQARQYFIEVEKREQAAVPSGPELLALAVVEAQKVIEAGQQKIVELTPKAKAWDVMVSSNGDYAVDEAAKILSREPSIEIGRNRLFTFMQELGWIYRHGARRNWHAYQTQVDNGRIKLRMTSAFLNAKTGEMENPAPTIRITAKGVDALRAALMNHSAVAA